MRTMVNGPHPQPQITIRIEAATILTVLNACCFEAPVYGLFTVHRQE
jgi:hypothetical protein